MKITVILCTYNRCQSLAKALASVAVSELPDFVDWDVVVVDNNSSDQTREIVESFCHQYPNRFQYLFEPKQGKSHALNAALRTTESDVVAFMDDDVTVEPTWLRNISAPLEKSEWAGVGGRILPERAFSMPRWLSTRDRYALAPLALFDLGPESAELTEAPFGTNMAFRREKFAKYGDFRTDLGPRPGSEIRNEDTEFGSRLLAGGERFWYEPSAIVFHAVPHNRVQKKYMLAWWLDKARADVREHGVPRDTNCHVMGVPLYMFRRLAVWTLRWMIGLNPASRFSCKRNVWTVAGTIMECYIQSSAPR